MNMFGAVGMTIVGAVGFIGLIVVSISMGCGMYMVYDALKTRWRNRKVRAK